MRQLLLAHASVVNPEVSNPENRANRYPGVVALTDRQRIRAGLAGDVVVSLWSALAVRSSFVRFRFPAEVIVVAVRWYVRYALSYRDVEVLLAERVVEVDHVTVYRLVHRFTPSPAGAACFARHRRGDRWFAQLATASLALPHLTLPSGQDLHVTDTADLWRSRGRVSRAVPWSRLG
jgi:hypothetical protein